MGYKIGAQINIDGEQEYRQTLKNMQDSLKTLGSEMKTVTSQFDKNDTSTENLTAQNKVLNKQIEEQKKYLDELQKGLSASADKYGENNTVTQSWQRTVNEATSQLNTMERQIKSNTETINKNDTATDNLGDEVDNLGTDLKETEKKALTFGDVLKANLASGVILGGVKALASGIKNVANGVIDLATETASYADNILTLSSQTGIAVDTLQELTYMQELTDVSVETVTGSMAKQIKQMKAAQDGTELSVEAYKKLNVEYKNTDGSLRDSETVYWEVIDALGTMQNETERDATAMQLLGKSAQDLNPIIKIGSKGVAAFAKEAKNAGAVLDNDTIESLGETDDAMQRITQAAEIAKRKFGAEMAPYVTKAAEKITDKITDMDDEFAEFAGGALEAATDGLLWLMDNAKYIASGVAGITSGLLAFKVGSAISTGVSALNASWKAYKVATEGATIAQWAMNAAQTASPVGVLSLAVGGLVAGMALYAASVDDTNELVDEQVEKLKTLTEESNIQNDTITANQEARKENIKTIESEVGASQALADELFDLADKENKTNKEKQLMVSLVDEINDIMPELNLTIDKQTGLLNKQRIEVNKSIEAQLKLYKAKAAQENLTSVSQEMFDKELSLTKLENERSKSLEKQVELQTKIKEIYDDKSKKDREMMNDSREYREALKLLTEELDANSVSIEADQTKLQELTDEFNQSTDYIKENADVLIEYADTTDEAATRSSESITKMRDAYDVALTDTEEKIKSQMGLFDEFALNTEISGKMLLENLQSQIDGVTNWKDNLISLAKKGVSDGLIAELRALGPASASEIAALNELTEVELDEYVRLWREKTLLASETATELMEDTKFDIYKYTFKIGEYSMDGFAEGVRSKYPKIQEAITSGLAGAVKAGNKELQIQSPSKVFARMGGYSAEGYGEGWEEQIEKAKRIMANSLKPSSNMTYRANGMTIDGTAQAASSTVTNTATIDYDKLTSSIMTAIKKYNPKIILNNDVLGSFVSSEVAKEMNS